MCQSRNGPLVPTPVGLSTMLIPSGRNSMAAESVASCSRKCSGGLNPKPGSTPTTFMPAAAALASATFLQVPSR